MTAPATLDHAGIAERIPHHGRMCLLDGLQSWNEVEICCTAIGHAEPEHPLRTPGGLLAPCAIEYAAQAMALHGALLAADSGAAPSPGFLASVRAVVLAVRRFDDAPPPLVIRAQRSAGNALQIAYAFEVVDGAGGAIASGRATVVLNTPLRA